MCHQKMVIRSGGSPWVQRRPQSVVALSKTRPPTRASGASAAAATRLAASPRLTSAGRGRRKIGGSASSKSGWHQAVPLVAGRPFAAMLNEYVSTHPDIAVQTDGDLQFDSRSLGHLLAEAAKAGDQVKKKMGAGKQGNHWAVRAPQAFGRHQTAVDERTLRGLREDRQKLRDFLRLQPEGPPEASGASKTAAPANGLHRDSLSLEYKMTVRWALVRSNCPQRTFSEVHTMLVYFTMKEMGLEPDLGTVASFVPTHLAGILDFCADMDDLKMTEEAKNVNAAFGFE